MPNAAAGPSIRQARPGDYGKLMALGAIWGSSFMFVSIALEGFPPLAVSSLRVTIGAVVLTLAGLALGEKWPRGARLWFWIAVVGFLNTALPFSLIAIGQQGVAANRAAILMAAAPFATLLMSHIATHDDRISGAKLAGLTFGISGVVLVIGLDALTQSGQSLAGQFAIMAAACCYAASNVLTRKIAHLPPVLGSGCFLMTASLYMGPAVLYFAGTGALTADLTPWAAVTALGVAPTALAYVLRFQLIRDAGSTFMSQVGYLVPIFGVLWAWAVLGEIPPLSALGALVLILLGIRVTQWKPRPARKPAE